ncbi:MAG: efflux RND transporter periplasmic adaptor subunit, partial [Vicinamibacteria bacterium]
NKVARVAPRIGGRVARILVDFGQAVRAGQALAQIDSPELGEALAQWRKTRSVFNVRQRDYERAKKLLDGKAISQGEFLSREGEFQVARSEMENADSRLHLFGLSHEEQERLTSGREIESQFPLRSPIAGRIIDRQINPGEVVEAGKTLFTVGDIENLWLLAQLYEKDLARVRAGQEIEVSTDAFPNERFKGVIDYVGEQVDPATRTVRARSVIRNPGGKLKPGMFVEAHLSVASDQPVLTVPSGAIQQVDAAPTVFVEVSPNVFEPRSVEVGRSGPRATEIKKGLHQGERVVSEGSLTLKAELQKAELAED